METTIEANGKYLLLQKEEPKLDSMRSALLLSSDDLNPSLLYGKVISFGGDCKYDYLDDYVYVNKLNAIKLNHDNKEYYIVTEDDIYAYVTEVENSI